MSLKLQKPNYTLALAGVLALMAAAPAVAQISCSPTNQYSFAFASQPTATLNYANSYNYAATRPAGGTVNFTVSFQTFNTSSTVVAGVQMPAISTLVTGSNLVNSLVVGAIFTGRTANIAANNKVVATTFTFAQPVREMRLFVHDVDFAANQFRDYVQILGRNGAATYTGRLSTPYTNNNFGGPLADATSTHTFGPTNTPVTITVDQAAGLTASGNNADNGNIDILFEQPVTSVEIRYGNAPFTTGETVTGQQAIGFSRLSFCPMPQISVAKTSAPVATTGINRFAIPGADVDYTLTVTNNGGSTVDINSTLLADLLPPGVTFFNGDIDTVNGGTQNFIFTPNGSGLTMAAGNIAYSNNGGASYAYSPAAGYDPAVTALRFSPQGTMAANSSFTIVFRTQVK
ncbi:MAG: hypothetical protein U5J78_03960 [Parasphingorhabdus sp.]|nr:hypothetical protein [Parasphingorhabdus sp.]